MSTIHDDPVAGEPGEIRETFRGLVEEIRRGRFATEAEVVGYLRSDASTYAARMVYFGADAWRVAGLF